MLQLPPGMQGCLIRNMYERHHQMARMLLIGCTEEQVATAVGCSVSHISNIKRSPIFQQKMAYLRSRSDDRAIDVAASLGARAYKSLELLEQVRDGELTEDIRLRTHVAQDLLDRAGHGKITKSENRLSISHIDAEALDHIKARSYELRERLSNLPVTDAVLVEEAA